VEHGDGRSIFESVGQRLKRDAAEKCLQRIKSELTGCRLMRPDEMATELRGLFVMAAIKDDHEQ